jgi:hypothetical protein
MRISKITKNYLACNETFKGGGERREGRENSIAYSSVGVTEVAFPPHWEVAILSCERL